LEEEIFRASSKEEVVKALGIQVNCKLQDLHVLVNGVDITKNVVLEEVRIVVEAKEVSK
jgi:phosphopantetheinyl transferase